MRDPLQRAIGRNSDHVELVDFVEFFGFGHRGTGHAADFLVELEVILQSNRGQRLRFLFDFHAFFGFDCLMQTITPLASLHQTTGEFVDDDDLAIFDDVVHVTLIQIMGL